MPPLTSDELKDFLTGGRHIMKLATITDDGFPYVNPVWYHYDGDTFLIAGRGQARWVANIRRDQRVSVCIDTYEAPYTRVMGQALAEIADPAWLGDWESWAVRYLGEEAGHRYYDETRHIPRVLIKIAPKKLTTWGGGGWHPRYKD